MGGPGLLALLGSAQSLPKVDAPTDKKILVDVEAFHRQLVRAFFNDGASSNSVEIVKSLLMKRLTA